MAKALATPLPVVFSEGSTTTPTCPSTSGFLRSRSIRAALDQVFTPGKRRSGQPMPGKGTSAPSCSRAPWHAAVARDAPMGKLRRFESGGHRDVSADVALVAIFSTLIVDRHEGRPSDWRRRPARSAEARQRRGISCECQAAPPRARHRPMRRRFYQKRNAKAGGPRRYRALAAEEQASAISPSSAILRANAGAGMMLGRCIACPSAFELSIGDRSGGGGVD